MYNPLLRMQIPKVQKDTDDLTVFLGFWDLNASKKTTPVLWNPSFVKAVKSNYWLMLSAY